MGVIVKVGEWTVPLGVDVHTGMTSSLDETSVSSDRLFAATIDSFDAEKCWAMLSSVSPSWTIYRTS